MGKTFFGVELLNENEQAPSGSPLRIFITLENPKEVKKGEKFEENLKKLYNKFFIQTVGEIHKYLIRLTPIHTGKLRGGWTAFLDKYRIDYSKQIFDTSLYDTFKRANKTEAYKDYAFDQGAVNEGKALSKLEDQLPDITDVSISNTVDYSDALDFGTSTIPARHFTIQARYKGEFWFEEQFDKWIQKIAAAGALVDPPEAEEIDV